MASPRRIIGLRTLCCLSFPRACAAGGASRRLLRPFGQNHDGSVCFGARKRSYDEPERVPSLLEKIFSYFFPPRCSLVSEGSSRRMVPWELGGPDSVG